MKTFNRIFAAVIILILIIFAAANLFFYNFETDGNRPYRVEIERLALEIEENGFENTDISECRYVVNIEKSSAENPGVGFFDTSSDYSVREIGGKLYRFDYISQKRSDKKEMVFAVNIILSAMSGIIITILIFVRSNILSPFERLKNVPYELSRGNLTVPVRESKSRFFGKFVWGVDLLRENIEEQKRRELMLQKEKKTLLLSLSHDIKTPLAAIKLYAKALTKNLYPDKERQDGIAEKINRKADEIEEYVSQIIAASREDFLSLEVDNSEFYLSDLMKKIMDYYTEKLALIRTDFYAAKYENCLLMGDLDRSVEVMQNIIENAIKYGDGQMIGIDFSEEENCRLITVKNSGCTLADTELLHIFDSFWRGANSENTQGSGLGLHICRQLMHKMNGEIFAEIKDGDMLVTIVFAMA